MRTYTCRITIMSLYWKTNTSVSYECIPCGNLARLVHEVRATHLIKSQFPNNAANSNVFSKNVTYNDDDNNDANAINAAIVMEWRIKVSSRWVFSGRGLPKASFWAEKQTNIHKCYVACTCTPQTNAVCFASIVSHQQSQNIYFISGCY